MGTPIPFGWLNTLTPASATVNCGYITQSDVYTTTGATEVAIGFNNPASWSTTGWTPVLDSSGTIYSAAVQGIYTIGASQSLTVFNAADITNPVVLVVLTIASAGTTEFNYVFANQFTVPITTDPINLVVNVSGIASVEVGSTMSLSVQSLSGNISITSQSAIIGSVPASLYWNLIAQGIYGNAGVLV